MEQRVWSNPCISGQLTDDRGGTAGQWGMDGHFNNKQRWVSWMSTRKEMNLDCYLTSYTKINSREVINLNVKVKTK